MKPRVLMVISQFYPRLGGAEQQALNLARALRADGLAVSVLTRRIDNLPNYETIQDIPVYRHIRAYPGTRHFSIAYLLSALWFFVRRRNDYDIIHCHIAQGFHSPAALLCRALLGAKVVIKVAATGPLSDFKTLASVRFGSAILRQLRHADRIVCPCSQAASEARAAGIARDRIALIPNGVDTGYFVPAGGTGRRADVIFVGRLDHMKGVHVLLQAVQILKGRGVRQRFHIIGDGPDRPALEAMAQQLNIKESALFAGESPDVLAYLQRSAVFVLPSLSEGLSNVILEAMACGLPVVATRVGGNVELIEDHISGLLVGPAQPRELADALEQVLTNRALALRLGAAARTRALDKFSIISVAARYQELYEALLAGRS